MNHHFKLSKHTACKYTPPAAVHLGLIFLLIFVDQYLYYYSGSLGELNPLLD